MLPRVPDKRYRFILGGLKLIVGNAMSMNRLTRLISWIPNIFAKGNIFISCLFHPDHAQRNSKYRQQIKFPHKIF